MAIRLRKDEIDRLGLSEGDLIRLEIEKAVKGKLDLATLPTFRDSDPRASVRHDEYLYGGRHPGRRH